MAGYFFQNLKFNPVGWRYNDQMRFIALITALLLSQAFAWADEAPEHVRARLIANVSAIEAGKPFMLGVELTIDPGWHVYWKNPGDSGLPTRVKFGLPEGFTVGELKFPVPTQLPQNGGIMNYGYENKVMLMAQVTPPKNADIKTQAEFKIQADVSWLVCKEECVPGKASLLLVVHVGEKTETANAAEFDQWIKMIPGKEVDQDILIKPDHSFEITWKHEKVSDLEFFPGEISDCEVRDVAIEPKSDTVTSIKFNLRPLEDKVKENRFDVVLAYTDAAGIRGGVEFRVPLSEPVIKN